MSDIKVKTAPGGSAGNAALFVGFLWLGLIGFGGVLLARSMLVERRRWLSGEQFTELLGCASSARRQCDQPVGGGRDGVSRAARRTVRLAGPH